jgi:murein DD-endopeptidase MepM/ murein hydrolase activator NlpD
MRDATVTNEIACAQNSRREVFELSMAHSLCNQCARNFRKWYRAFNVAYQTFCAAAAGVALVCSADFVTARSQGQRPLQMSVAPPTLHPGDVARIDVTGNADEPIVGSALGREVVFHFAASDGSWRALVGVDLETKPGEYELRISSGTRAAVRTLQVAPKQFRTRRLRVPGGFVNPPAEVLEQIASDRAALEEALALVSARRWSGPFVLPVDGRPSSNFGTRSYYNGEARAPHAGVDFAAAIGTPIRAANHGQVALAGPMYFTGETVVIDYGDRLFSIFAHLSEVHVKAGDTVEPGTIVGLVGATGRVTGPHLHWSVRLNEARVDPLSLVAATADAK